MTIYLERTERRCTRTRKRLADGVRARRNGLIIATPAGSHARVWSNEERARAVLAREFPGEQVVGIEERRQRERGNHFTGR